MDLPRNAPTMEDELDYLLSQVSDSDSDLHELLMTTPPNYITKR